MIWSRPKRDIMDYLVHCSPTMISATPKQIGEACGKSPHLARGWAKEHLQVLRAEGYMSRAFGHYKATLEGKRARVQAPQLRLSFVPLRTQDIGSLRKVVTDGQEESD